MLEWDLKALFKSDNECVAYTKNELENSLKFKEYEGRLPSLSKEEFLKALKEYEALSLGISKILSYAYLKFAKDTSLGGFLAKFENECKKIEENLLFFELEFCELEDGKANEFCEFASEYKYYLNNLILNKKYNLSKKEERIILRLSNTGGEAFSRLFDEQMSTLQVKFEGKKISEEEILSKLYDNDRKVRKKAAKAFTKALKKNISLLNFILNMIKTELKTICELRGYENAEIPRHLGNQISQKSVDALIKTAEKNFHLVEKFYKKKKQLLGLSKLKDYDRYAPLGKEASFSYDEAKKLVLEAFNDFEPKFASIAKKAFDEGWIDVYPAKGKQGGAFSHSTVSQAHPYIMLNFTNTRRDVFTLAHELGHSIHQSLSYNVSHLNQNTPLTTAETASVFAEMLVFDYLKSRLKKEELIALYAAKIEDIFATLFRQINFTTFERQIHAQQDELSGEKLAQTWMQESTKMFGDSVELSKDYALWYSYIPHFIHSPFYCYAYAYAQLLVLALYGLYKSGKCSDFKQIYIQMLSSGGAISPKDLIAKFGFDIDDTDFWKIGMKEVEKIIDEFLELKC